MNKAYIYLLIVLLILTGCIGFAATNKTPKTTAAQFSVANSKTFINVKDFGAIGDQKADDTKAFQKALKEGKSKKLTVLVPQGKYRITQPLEMSFQSMTGAEPGGWNADAIPMAKLYIDQKAGPAITMYDAASIYGIAIEYPEDKKVSPPAILLAGNGPSIENVRIQYCWDGIISHNRMGPGRANIENVFIVSPGGTGVYISGTLDIATIRNIEVWNNLNRPNVTAFKFGYNDGFRASQLVAFNTQVGFELVDAVGDQWPTGTWGTFTDCDTDAVSIAWKTTGKKRHTIGILGGFYQAHHMFLELDNPNIEIRAVNNAINTNGAPGVMVKQSGPLSIVNARFSRAWDVPNIPFVNLESAESVVLSNCNFSGQSPILSLGKGVKQLSMTGNLFNPSDYKFFFSNERDPNAQILIEHNLGK